MYIDRNLWCFILKSTHWKSYRNNTCLWTTKTIVKGEEIKSIDNFNRVELLNLSKRSSTENEHFKNPADYNKTHRRNKRSSLSILHSFTLYFYPPRSFNVFCYSQKGGQREEGEPSSSSPHIPTSFPLPQKLPHTSPRTFCVSCFCRKGCVCVYVCGDICRRRGRAEGFFRYLEKIRSFSMYQFLKMNSKFQIAISNNFGNPP